MITFEELKKNKEIRTYIDVADRSLAALGFTEHSFAHVVKVAQTAGDILQTLGRSQHEVELVKVAGFLHDIGNAVNRTDHSQSGAVMAFQILRDLGMEPEDLANVVTAIGNQAFGGCTHLSKVSIPKSVTSIGFDAFHNTAYYNDVNNWEENLLYIDGCLVAANPDKLTGTAIIKDGTRLIAGDAFFGSKITAVSIPASVKVVDARAFGECKALTEVHYGGTEAEWKAMRIADENTILSGATKHYRSVQEKADDKPIDWWLVLSIVSGVVAVVTGVLMFLPTKKQESADAETPAEGAVEEETPTETPKKAKKSAAKEEK